MFEKYDGVRAFWNPEKKAFYTRTGKTLKVPQDLIDEMPNTFLDGEIWYLFIIFILHTWKKYLQEIRFGRDSFQEAMKLIHNLPVDWSRLRYMLFDVPNHQGTYAERYAFLGITLPPLPPSHHTLCSPMVLSYRGVFANTPILQIHGVGT